MYIHTYMHVANYYKNIVMYYKLLTSTTYNNV